jgi:hypothetical protein
MFQASIVVLSLLTSVAAQMSICNKYTTALLGDASKANQELVLRLLVSIYIYDFFCRSIQTK